MTISNHPGFDISIHFMIQRYLEASNGTYELFRPWLPHIATAIIVGHLCFSVLNVVQEQSESFLLRTSAILVMLPYVLCSFIEKANRMSELQACFLLAIFLTGPLFLLAGLLNELRSPVPDIVVVIRREYEFLASFGVFLLASVDLLVAFLVGTLLSVSIFLIAALLIPLSWETLQLTWITLMSGYIAIYVALVLIARRRTDQAASRSELSEAIGSSIAHELRTPLLSIKTKAAALEPIVPKLLDDYGADVESNPRKLSLLSKAPTAIVKEAESATTLIDIFLMNVKGPKDKFRHGPFSLGSALSEAITRYPYRSERERQAITYNELPSELIRGPRILLVHVFFNILKNSFEQLGAVNEPIIKIVSYVENHHAVITFTDNGPGIPHGDQSKIFEPFYTNTEFGTGVGLAFCKSTMEKQFSGTISCSSEQGKFTKMILEFPLDTPVASNC